MSSGGAGAVVVCCFVAYDHAHQQLAGSTYVIVTHVILVVLDNSNIVHQQVLSQLVSGHETVAFYCEDPSHASMTPQNSIELTRLGTLEPLSGAERIGAK